jgi:hypothetical protein
VPEFTTIADVMNWAKLRIAEVSGVPPASVNLDLKFEM